MKKKTRDIDTLAMMLKRGDIGKVEFEAGRRFRAHFLRSGLRGNTCIHYESLGGGTGPANPSEYAVVCGPTVYRVLERLGGMNCLPGRAVWNVLGLGRTMAEWASAEGRDVREAKGTLVGAISLLAKAYGYV